MDKREAMLEGAKEKWVDCPDEEHWKFWWTIIGCRQCFFCEYYNYHLKVKCSIKQKSHPCRMQSSSKNKACAVEWENCEKAFDSDDFPRFRKAFNAMHERIYALTVDDIKVEKEK